MPVRSDSSVQGTTATPSYFVPEVPDGFYLGEDGEIYPNSHRDEVQDFAQGTMSRVNLTKPDNSVPKTDTDTSKIKRVTSRLADDSSPDIPMVRKATAYGVHYGSATPPGVSYKMPDVEVYTSIPAQYTAQNAPVVCNMGTVQDKMSWNVTVNKIRLAVVGNNYDRALNTVGYLKLINPDFDTTFLCDVILNTRRAMEFLRGSGIATRRTLKAVALGIGAGVLGLISLSLCPDLVYDFGAMLTYNHFAFMSVVFDGFALLATSCGSIACTINCVLQARKARLARYADYVSPFDRQRALDYRDYLLKVLDDLYIR